MNAHVTFQIKNLKTNDLTNRFLTYLQSKKCPCSINRSCFVKKNQNGLLSKLVYNLENYF